MDIEKLIKELGKSIGKIICNKKEENNEKIDIEQMSSIDIFKIILNKVVHEGNYNKAEDLIFDELEKIIHKKFMKLQLTFIIQS